MKFFHSISFGWMIAVVLAAVIVAHLGLALFSRHVALTTSFASVLLVVLLAVHLGISGPAYVLFRRRSRK
jgi:hypothetical protein